MIFNNLLLKEKEPEDKKQIWEKLKKNIKNKNLKEAKNLVAFKSNILCIYDQEEHVICCGHLEEDKYISNIQVLVVSNPPVFEVNSIVFNKQDQYLAVFGSRGINIVELPRQWGPLNTFEGGKSKILCRSCRIDERLFVCNLKIVLLECRWHPGSLTSTHIVTLTNDDYLRIYDVTHLRVCLQEIKLNDRLQNEPNHSKFAQSLGETTVSFDFGPPIANPKTELESNSITVNEELCLWPIYILKGNGDILLVYHNVVNPYVLSRILGPLTMRPPAEDNYGVDACSIICIDSAPPFLVIATSSGILYHCISLVCDDDLLQKSSLLPTPTLYVYESLELTISLISLGDQDILCPIRLHKPFFNPQVYFCSHIAGVHIVNVPLLAKLNLKNYKIEDTEPSIIEHLICTKPLSLTQSSLIPLGIGMVINRFYFSLIVLLSSGEFLVQRLSSLNLEASEISKEEYEIKTNLPSIEFTTYINQILKRSVNTPLIKSEANKEPSKEECLQMLLNTTQILRQEYLFKMDTASEIISTRIKSLMNNKILQLEEIEKCLLQKEDALERTTKLTNKYDLCLENQEKLSFRIENVLQYLQNCQAHLSESELMVKQSLLKYIDSIKKYRETFSHIQLKFDYQQELDLNKLKKATKSEKPKEIPVANQLKAIRKILNNQSEEIALLVKKVNSLKQYYSKYKLII